MDDIIKFSKNDTPFSLAEKIIKITGGVLPVKIAFEESKFGKAILENTPIKNSEIGIADWITEGLILGDIPPGIFKTIEDNPNADKTKPYSLILIYEKFKE